MKKVECPKCGIKFEKDIVEDYELCDKCKRKRGTETYTIIAIILLIIGLIAGIVVGETNPIVKLTYESSVSSEFNDYEEVFNATLAFAIWGASIISSLPLFAFSSICRRLDIIIDKKDT